MLKKEFLEKIKELELYLKFENVLKVTSKNINQKKMTDFWTF